MYDAGHIYPEEMTNFWNTMDRKVALVKQTMDSAALSLPTK